MVAGIDPAKNLANIANKKVFILLQIFLILKMFYKLKKFRRKAGLILCFNTFAHAENLRDIVKNIIIIDEKCLFLNVST